MENKNIIKASSFAEAYKQLSETLLNSFQHESSPRGFKIRECLNQVITITNPYSNMFSNICREPNLDYLLSELKLYFSGNNNSIDFSQASKFWENLKNTDGTINSAYGYLLFKDLNKYGLSQWEWAKESLLKDIDSRQAVLHFNNSTHQHKSVKDFPCTMFGIFNIRKNKLNFTIHMRSTDHIFGTSYDMPFFMLLMQCMRLDLITQYPELELGYYTHISNSYHVYEKHFDLLQSSLKSEFAEVFIPKLTVNPILNLDRDIFKDSKFGKWLFN